MTARVDMIEKAERRVKEHLRNMRQNNTSKFELLSHVVSDISIFS